MTIDVVQCTVPMTSASINDPYDMSWHGAQHYNSFLAASTHHSGDWLFAVSIAVSIAPCGLKLDGEAVRVTVGLRLELDLCEPRQCHCGSAVDARGLHSFVCKRAAGRSVRHYSLNDLVARSFAAAGTPFTKERRPKLHSSCGRAASRCVGTLQ